MNYAGNLPDWHQYSNVTSQTGGTEGGPVSNVQNATASNHFPFMPPPPGIGAAGFNGIGLRNDGGLGKCQNDANYGPRSYQTLAGGIPSAAAAAPGPPAPAAPSNPSTNGSGNPSLSSLMHMSSCCGHYGSSTSRACMMDNVNNSVNGRDASTDEIGYRANQVPLSRSLNATNMNVNPAPLGAIIPRSHHAHVGSMSTTHSQTSCVGCKAPYCNLDPGMSYNHWDHKFNGYPRPGFPNESRRYANEGAKKDSFEPKDTGLMGANAFNVDNGHFKYRKDNPRNYPSLPPNYPMQNYNFPMDYQKYPYGLKPGGNQANKYQEPNPVVSKYNKPVYQNHPAGMMQKSMMQPIPSAVDLTAQSQNPYYNNGNNNSNNNNNNNNNNNSNPQFPRNIPNEFNRECHLSLDKMQNNSGNNNNNSNSTNNNNNNNNNSANIHHSTYQRYHMYQQKIAMERFAMENHLREFTRIPGYQSHPKYKACMHRYRELVKSHQAIEYQNSLQDSAPRVTPPGVMSPINLQFDQNGHLINSHNYLHNGYFSKMNPNNPVPHASAESERNMDHQSKMLPIRQSNGQELPPNSSLQAALPVTSESQFVPGTNAPTERQASRDGHEDGVATQKKSGNDKPNIDVRQFLANWDESEEEENNHAEGPVVVVATFPGTLDGSDKDGGQRIDEGGNLNLKEFATSFNKSQIVKPGSIIHCITNGPDEVPTIHIVDEFESNIAKLTGAEMVVDGGQRENVSFFDRGGKNVHATVKVAVPENLEGGKKQQVESGSSESNGFSKTFQKSSGNGGEENLKNVSDGLRKQNSFEESHNPDDISLPDLPMSECTPISTTLNTPIHSDGEESSERVQNLSTLPSNPIELIPNSPMISFSHSPMKIDGYDNLKRKESASRLEFGFDQVDEGVGKKKKFAGEGEMNFDIVHRSSKKDKDDNASKEREKDAEIWISSNKEPGNADKFLIDTSQTSRNLSQKCLNVVNVAFEDIPPENQDIGQASRKDKLLSDTIESNSMDAVKRSATGTSQVIFELSESQQNLDTNLSLERESIYSSNTGEETFSNALSMMPLIPGEDNEEPKIPVPPMEENCLTKIIKDTLPLTNVNVLESSDDDKLEKEDDIWREVRYINESPENGKGGGKSKSNEINATALTNKLSDLRDSLISNNENSIDANFAEKLFSSSDILQPLESCLEARQGDSGGGKDRMKSLKEYRKSKRKDEEEEPLLPLALPSSEKPKKSDFEIQVTNVNFKIKDNDVRKELLMMRAKNDDTRESIKIEINLSRSDKPVVNLDTDQTELVPVGRRKSSTLEEIEEDSTQKRKEERSRNPRTLGKTRVNLIDTTIHDSGSKEEGLASTRGKSVIADEEAPRTSTSEAAQKLKHLESKKLYSFDINPRNPDDSCLTDSFDRHDSNVDFEDFDVDSLVSYDKDPVDDSSSNRRYYKTALRYKNCEIYKNPDNFHAPSPPKAVPGTTSPESSVDMDTVPVYTTKDGKIKYSPNPKYTYRLLLKEARDRDGSRFSSSRGHRKSEPKKAHKKRKADYSKKYGESSRAKNPSPPPVLSSPVPTGYFNPWDEKSEFLDYRKKSNDRRSGSVESEFLKCNPTAFAYLDDRNTLSGKKSATHDFYNNEDSLESVRTYASHVHEFPKHSTFHDVLLTDHRETNKRHQEVSKKEKQQGKEKNSSLHVSSSTKNLPDLELIGHKMSMGAKVEETVRIADSTSDVHPKCGKSSIEGKESQTEAATRDKDIDSFSRSIDSENRELRSIANKLNALIDLQSIKAQNERFLVEERKALERPEVEDEFGDRVDLSKSQESGVRVASEGREEEKNHRMDFETRVEEKLEGTDARVEGLPILDDNEGEEGLLAEKEKIPLRVDGISQEEDKSSKEFGNLETILANPITESVEEQIEEVEEDRRFPAEGEKDDLEDSKKEETQSTIVEKLEVSEDSKTDPNLRSEEELAEEESKKMDIPNIEADIPEDSAKGDTFLEECESSKADADLFVEKPPDLEKVEDQLQLNPLEDPPDSEGNLNNEKGEEAEEERSSDIQEAVPEKIINEENVLEDSEYLSPGEKREKEEIQEKIVPSHYMVSTEEISGDCCELNDSEEKTDFQFDEEEKSLEFPAEVSLENHGGEEQGEEEDAEAEEEEEEEKEMPKLVPTEPRAETEEVSSRAESFEEISSNSKLPLLPKIPKILIKNARSRPTTPTIEEIPEPKNSKTVKPKLKEDSEKQVKMIPKMKISLEDKFPKVVVKEEEIEKKVVPKVKIRKIKRRSSEETNESPPPRLSPKLILRQDVESDENDSKEGSNDLPELEDNSRFSASEEKMVPKLIIKKTEKSVAEERKDLQNLAKKLKKEEKEHNLLSEKIPKVIIKRTIASAEFKYEISKDKKEALTKIAKWQPEVKLQRYEALDTFARELKDKKNHPTRFRWSRSLNELSWNRDGESRNVKSSSSDCARVVKLSRSNSTSCLSPSRSKHSRRLSDYDAREFELAKECRKNSKDREGRREREVNSNSKTKTESEGRRRRSSRDKFECGNPRDISEDAVAETVVPPRIVENYDNFYQIFGKGTTNRDGNSLELLDTSKEEMSEKLDSIIKVESSDDSQSTIEILVASPTEELEIPSCGIDSENGRLFPEEAIPAEFELEFANDGSLSCPKDEKREKSSPGSVPVEKTGSRSERSKSSRDRTAHRGGKKLCCSDSLVKEVLAAKETLRRCLSKSKEEKTNRPKTAAEKKQGSSFDLSYLQKLPKVSNAESALRDVRFNTKQGKSTDIETKTERPVRVDKKSRSKVSMNHRSTISLKNFKRHLSNEEKIVGKSQPASAEKSVVKDGNSLGSYKIPKISSRQRKEAHSETETEPEAEKEKEEKVLEKKSKEDKMPILEPQVEVTVNFQAEADRDTSRSPPVITNQDSADNNNDCTNNAKINESQLNVDDDMEKSKVIEKDAADTSVADIVMQLAYHEKATIKHRRYCTLCERWFPTTARHQRHLAGYQHKYMELTQRRTIHALFLLFTGNPCPRLASANVLRTDCALGELTPLQLAVQDIAISLDKSRESVVKEEDDKKN